MEPYFTVMAGGRWTPFAKCLKILIRVGGIKNKGYSNFLFSAETHKKGSPFYIHFREEMEIGTTFILYSPPSAHQLGPFEGVVEISCRGGVALGAGWLRFSLARAREALSFTNQSKKVKRGFPFLPCWRTKVNMGDPLALAIEEITMAHEVETMAYAHEVPWHGLGNNVPADVSIAGMLQAAGLDWEVERHPLYYRIGKDEVMSGRSAFVRSTDSRLLTIASNDWKPLQNARAMEFFREYCEAGGMTLETAGSLRKGKIVWALARVGYGFTLNGRDAVNSYVLLVSPHEVGKAITVRITSVRVVCANTLAMAGGVEGKGSAYRQSHVMDFDIAKAKETVRLAREGIERMELDAKALQSLKLSEFDTVRFLAKFFQPTEEGQGADAQAEAMISDPSLMNSAMTGVTWAVKKAKGATPGNGWGVLNGVTYYTDHMAGREGDSRLFNSWLGKGDTLKSKVRADLLELV